MLSMTTSLLTAEPLYSGSSPAAMGRTMLPCNDISLQLSQCQQQDPATVQGAALQNWSSFPRNLPGIYVLIFPVGSIFPSALLLPVMPALKNVQVAMYSGSGGPPLLAGMGNVLPWYLFQQNGGGLRNNSLLTGSVSSVTFSPGAEWWCCVWGSRKRDVLKWAVLLKPANGEIRFRHTYAPVSQGCSWILQHLEINRQLGNSQVDNLEIAGNAEWHVQ